MNKQLSAGEIAEYAYDAGWRGDDLTRAVATALAESNGDRTAHNPVPPDNSYGLWQINMLGALGPERRRKYGLSSDQDLLDPAKNAEVAYDLFKESGWNPWPPYPSPSYFRHGDYLSHLPAARKAARATERNGGGGGHHDDRDPDPGPPKGGYEVDPKALDSYAEAASEVAGRLRDLAKSHVRQVRDLSHDSFGDAGRESGFTPAVQDFGEALHLQVRTIGKRINRLGRVTANVAADHRGDDEDIKGGFRGLFLELK